MGHDIQTRINLYRHLNIGFAGFLDDDPEKEGARPDALRVAANPDDSASFVRLLSFAQGQAKLYEEIGDIYAEAKKWAQPISIHQVKLQASKLGGDAGLYGAGCLALQTPS